MAGPPFDSHEMEEFHLSDNGPPFDSHEMEEVIARYNYIHMCLTAWLNVL